MHASLAETPELSPVATQSVTLFELIEAVSDASECEADVLATIAHMLRSGSARFTRPAPPSARPEA